MEATAAGGGFHGGPATQGLEGRWKSAGWCQLGKQGRGPVTEGSDSIALGLTRGTRCQMTLDLDALGTAQPLVEIGVQLLFRNVPH
jgi:hypothetical protein